MATRLNQDRQNSLEQAFGRVRSTAHHLLRLLFQCVCTEDRVTDLRDVHDAVAYSMAEQAKHMPEPPTPK